MTSKETHADNRPSLEREKVVTVALELLNEVGFEGLTVRKLAERLNVKAAALYWHFENKQDLIDQVAAKIIEDEFKSESSLDREAFAEADWRTVLANMGHGMRNALRRHRDGALVVANADLARSKSFKGRATMIEKLLDEGFDTELIFSAMFSVGRFTLGCVFEEQAEPHPGNDMRQLHKQRMSEVLGERPALTGRITEIDSELLYNPDRQFERGLQVILDGIGQQIARISG
jgi:AcrR family transcriptional regulator